MRLTVYVERQASTGPAIAMAVVMVACGVYANLSFLVTNREDFKYFPPFRANENQNFNAHLGGEYFNIASALADGEGFSNPFRDRTGPTAWMPPVLPMILAGLLRLSGGNQNIVTAIVIVLQVATLIVTGLVVLADAQRTTVRLDPPRRWRSTSSRFSPTSGTSFNSRTIPGWCC